MIERLLAWQNGDLDFEDAVDLFQELIDTGAAWQLEGHIGRTANGLIEVGYCTLGPVAVLDHYGATVPGIDDVVPGSVGSREYAATRTEET